MVFLTAAPLLRFLVVFYAIALRNRGRRSGQSRQIILASSPYAIAIERIA
jgi:hypothetical protein